MSHECVKRIAEFARVYRDRSGLGRTPLQIYDETGYASQHAAISQSDIEAVVSNDLLLVEDWLAFTADKRWTPAWGLMKHSENLWVVFRVPKGGGRGCEVVFSSPIPACALMIRMEMEDFRLK